MLRLLLSAWFLLLAGIIAGNGQLLLLGAGGGGFGGSGGGGTTTFDPAFLNAGVALSGGNLIDTSNSTSGGRTDTRSVASHASGKFFAELTMGGPDGGTGVGLVNASQSLASTFSSAANGVEYFNDGNIYSNGASLAVIVSYVTGDVIDMAVDITNSLIWVRRNGGNWNNSAPANPATGVGGVTYSVTGPLFVATETRASGITITANFGGTAYGFTPPVGFGNW